MMTTNGHQNGHRVDTDIDLLYAWVAPPEPTAQPCPESLFSLTLKGTIGGQDAMLTVRGQTAAEFKQHLGEIRGLLDPPTPAAQPAASQGQDKSFCHKHQVTMKENHKDGRTWYSHQVDGQWCKGR